MKRREFIGVAGLVSGSLLLGKRGLSFPYQDEPLIFDEGIEWEKIRESFLLPENFCYLNTAGNGALPQSVMDAFSKAMKEDARYPGTGVKKEKWKAVKQLSANLLGDDIRTSEIALIGCATEGCNIVINGLPMTKGDEVIVSTHEHPAVVVPLINRLKRDGIVIKTFEPDLISGPGNIDRVAGLISKKTKLIFISHINFTTGQILPIKEIGQLAKENNIWFAVDGAQAAGNIPVRIDENVDFYTFSGHKWLLGPKRTGALYIRKKMLKVCTPVTVGGGSYDSFDIEKEKLSFPKSAERYEYGTINGALYSGLGDSIDFMYKIGISNIWDHNRKLAEQFLAGLEKINGIILKSPFQKEYRSSIVSFEIDGKNCMDVYHHLIRKKKIRVRPVFENGLNFIRASFHLYNNEEDVERLLIELRNL